MECSLVLVAQFLYLVCCCWAYNIPTTKLYIMKIEPELFNWTGGDISDLTDDFSQFTYRPSLFTFPDLPSWLHYTTSNEFNHGFLFGSPPNQQEDLEIEVIGFNKDTYETRSKKIKISVQPSDPVVNSVQMKVDRVSVEEMLSAERHGALLDVFRRDLWPESAADLHITFLASAVELGARLPLDPTHGEGVVIKISSKAKFSQNLHDLQQEIWPLRSKGKNCPDFKHTSVERFFKQHNFYLDWCAFRLLKYNTPEESETIIIDLVSAGPKEWQPVNKRNLPTRKYSSQKGFVMFTSLLGFTVVVALVSFIFCVKDSKHDEVPSSQLVQYEAGNTLRSLSAQKDTSTPESSPRVSMERTGLRPNPPPYPGVHTVTRDEFFDDEEAEAEAAAEAEAEANTWYC